MSQNAPTLEHFLARAERLLERLEPLLPPASPAPDWNAAAAFRWRKRGGVGFLQAIAQPATIRLADLQDIDEQKGHRCQHPPVPQEKAGQQRAADRRARLG